MDKGFHVELTAGLVDIAADRLIARPLGRRPVLYVEPVRRVGWRAAAKRLFDLVMAGSMLLLLLPLLAVCAVLVKLDSRGPVFFRQVRLGKDRKTFKLAKLRTMVVGAELMVDELQTHNEADGPLFKLREESRASCAAGRFLRKTSLDEVPQLWNVLRGEMSLVGPRPALESESEGWTPELALRLRVKPGITGMWQVNGRSSSSFEDYARPRPVLRPQLVVAHGSGDRDEDDSRRSVPARGVLSRRTAPGCTPLRVSACSCQLGGAPKKGPMRLLSVRVLCHNE